MLVVPIAGDLIKSIDGLPFKVLSYSNYHSDGPSVLVEKTGDVDSVSFRDIGQIGKSKVKLLKNAKGKNIFSADGVIDRQFHLPQPGDTITADPFSVGSADYVVVKLNLGILNSLAKGMILDVRSVNHGDIAQITLNQIIDIKQTMFSQEAFKKYYTDYSEKGV